MLAGTAEVTIVRCSLLFAMGRADGAVHVENDHLRRMAVLDEDFGTNLTLVEGNGGVGSCPVSVPGPTPRDLCSLYERERARTGNGRGRTRPKRARKSYAGRKWPRVAMPARGGRGSKLAGTG